MMLGSFSNDDGDGNENGTKAIGLLSKTTTLHVHHAFLYISLSSLHHYDVKMPNFTFYGGRKQAPTIFSFSFQTWERSPKKSTLGKLAFIWRFQRIGIDERKFEKTRICFTRDVFAAVAVVDAYALCYWRGQVLIEKREGAWTQASLFSEWMK